MKIIQVDDKTHQSLKIMASIKGMSMKTFIGYLCAKDNTGGGVYLGQSLKPIPINKYLEASRGVIGLSTFISKCMFESGSEGTGLACGAIRKQIVPNSTFEGTTFFSEIEFSDDEYIVVGHKCHMTLLDKGDCYIVTSLYVHPSKRLRGYARSFLESEIELDKPTIFDTNEGIKRVISTNLMMYDFSDKAWCEVLGRDYI